MIDLCFVTATPRWGTVKAGPKRVTVGQATAAFMEEFKSREATAIRTERGAMRIGRRLELNSGFGCFCKADDRTLRFVREATWYYTRSVHWKGTFASPSDLHALERACLKFRPELERDLQRLPLAPNRATHWRQSLLFAARVLKQGEIKMALVQGEDSFAFAMIRLIDAQASGAS